METLGYLYIALFLFAVVLLVCWIVLPFAVIGTKDILRDILAELRTINDRSRTRDGILGPKKPSEL